MTLSDIVQLRLINQQITQQNFSTPKEIVNWMGVMQAQDFEMSKWAVGIRLRESDITGIQAAIDKGHILRTHVLRPTWHLVSSDDIYWMVDFCARRIQSSLKSRWRELELSEKVLRKCYRLLEKALADGVHLTRDELKDLFSSAGIATDNNRLSHILVGAELEKIVCSGSSKGKKQTYALLDERVKAGKKIKGDEAAAALAARYFASHGPATLQDFTWWSGMSVTAARRAIAMNKSDLREENVNGDIYWMRYDYSLSDQKKTSAHLIPAYDEFVISYKDRTAIISPDHQKKALSSNGIFYPVIVIDGKAVGLWKRIIKSKSIKISLDFFTKPTRNQRQLLDKALHRFESFVGLPVELE